VIAMRSFLQIARQALVFSLFALLVGCVHTPPEEQEYQRPQMANFDQDFSTRLPQHEDTNGKKMVVVNPNVHAWGAYDKDGSLVRAGIATAGGAVCPPDAEGESDCRTGSGTFRITSMRGADCYSRKYPRPHGGGLMPYCMYFNNGQALHGSPDDIVVENNVSHGCVRMRIPDAEWMWSNFATVGTTVKVVPYES
jgi:lipoprotein-anchoring transpeptidase ErfK/SrfK